MLMRGGTSKGAYFLAEDLPVDVSARDDLLLRIMGAPDPRQIDGIGGAHPLTSKVAVVSRAEADGIDLDYLFLQIGVEAATVSTAQTCGNLLAGVVPFALERGLVDAADDLTRVRVRLVNTGDVANITVQTPAGRVAYGGDAAIDGVPGAAAPILIDLVPVAPLLPTGRVVEDVDGHRATLINNGMQVVLMRAEDFGIAGDESPAELESMPDLRAAVERARLAAGALWGLGDVSQQSVPKMILLSAPRAGGSVGTRAFIPTRVHAALGVLMGASVAAGVRIPGSVGADLAEIVPGTDEVFVEHPSGAFSARVGVRQDADGVWRGTSTAVRTARKLFDGNVFPRL